MAAVPQKVLGWLHGALRNVLYLPQEEYDMVDDRTGVPRCESYLLRHRPNPIIQPRLLPPDRCI